VIAHNITGTYNAAAGQVTNAALMKSIATTLRKPFWAPNVPSFVLRAMFGEMSLVLLKGVSASNEKIKKTGFKFRFEELSDALKNLLVR
jgi:NAD dependent epimerase/dehydratase family enzyme